jgi:nucleolar GTP-binding protein
MNFQDLKNIESAEFYLDVSFRKAAKRISEINSTIKGSNPLARSKNKELLRLDLMRASLTDSLMKILKTFPEIDELDIFYQELIKLTLDYKSLKKSLGALNWAEKKVSQFSRIYSRRIKLCNEYDSIIKAKKEFLGRISSIMKQINPYLAYLEESRKTMKAYPAIKTDISTICIFGFPNVGKSTLLSKLTTAKPEINSYPFTTKRLNLGYIKEPLFNVQIIDTPGTLDRIDKMNNIELQAYLAAKLLANLIVYVFDPTYEYTLDSQKQLLMHVRKFDKLVILYMSKADIADKSSVDEIRKLYPDIITDTDVLKEEMKRKLKN